MRKADLINNIAEKTGIPKVDVLVTLEAMFKEVKEALANVAVEIPEHFIPAFKPSKEFVAEVKKLKSSS